MTKYSYHPEIIETQCASKISLIFCFIKIFKDFLESPCFSGPRLQAFGLAPVTLAPAPLDLMGWDALAPNGAGAENTRAKGEGAKHSMRID